MWWICGYSLYKVFFLVLFGKNTLNTEILHVFNKLHHIFMEWFLVLFGMLANWSVKWFLDPFCTFEITDAAWWIILYQKKKKPWNCSMQLKHWHEHIKLCHLLISISFQHCYYVFRDVFLSVYQLRSESSLFQIETIFYFLIKSNQTCCSLMWNVLWSISPFSPNRLQIRCDLMHAMIALCEWIKISESGLIIE